MMSSNLLSANQWWLGGELVACSYLEFECQRMAILFRCQVKQSFWFYFDDVVHHHGGVAGMDCWVAYLR